MLISLLTPRRRTAINCYGGGGGHHGVHMSVLGDVQVWRFVLYSSVGGGACIYMIRGPLEDLTKWWGPDELR